MNKQLISIAVLGLVGFPGFSKEKPKNRPNILYIFSDDQSYRTVHCYPGSYPWVRTPNIDALASEGMRFSSCYTGTWSMPSRATALTGLHPHGIKSLHMTGQYPACDYDPGQLHFWPEAFRNAGYYTGMIGKWHLGPKTGHGTAWDYSAVWNHTVAGSGGYYFNQKMSFNGEAPVLVPGYSTDNYTQYAIDFINQRSKDQDQPWYLWLCYGAIHGPYTPPDRHKDAYSDVPPVKVPVDIFPPRPGKSDFMQKYGVWKRNPDGTPEGFDEYIRTYNRPVLSLDEGIGNVLKALAESGQLENTIVVYTADQGFAVGEHGFKWKYAPYDANLLAPLIVRWPGVIKPGTVCDHPVGGHDLVTTFFSLAGISLPWKMHGHDISRMFRKPDCKWEHPLMLENTARLYGEDTEKGVYPVSGYPCWVSLREGKYKYIRLLVENEIEELFDLEKDPEELTNLAVNPEYHKILAKFRQATLTELKRTDAKMTDLLPAVRVTGLN